MAVLVHVDARGFTPVELNQNHGIISYDRDLTFVSVAFKPYVAAAVEQAPLLAQGLISFRVFIIQTKFGQNLPITGNMMERVAFGNSLFGETI